VQAVDDHVHQHRGSQLLAIPGDGRFQSKHRSKLGLIAMPLVRIARMQRDDEVTAECTRYPVQWTTAANQLKLDLNSGPSGAFDTRSVVGKCGTPYSLRGP